MAPFGNHLSTCLKCGQPFICGDCIELMCPKCRDIWVIRVEEDDKPLDPKDYKTTWGVS